MTGLVRVKRGRLPWVTEPESSGADGLFSTEYETIVGDVVSIANGAFGDLQLNHPNPGDPVLLDLTNPFAPEFTVAGFFSIYLNVPADAPLTVDGQMIGAGFMGGNEYYSGTSAPQTAVGPPPSVNINWVHHAVPGDVLRVTAGNYDGSLARDFLCIARIARITTI